MRWEDEWQVVISYCLATGIAFVIKGEKESCVTATAVVCEVAALFSFCGVGQHRFEWGCGSQAHGWQLLSGQINNVFHAQQLQQLCRLLPRAVLPLDCPYGMDALTCCSSEGKGSIFYIRKLQILCENLSGGFPAKLRSHWCSAVQFVGSCQLLWHFVASL